MNHRLALLLVAAVGCEPSMPMEAPGTARRPAPRIVEPAPVEEPQPPPIVSRPEAEQEQAPCVGAHMGPNDTWIGGRRRLGGGIVETCTPNEAEIAAMPESAKKRLTAEQKKAIAERGRQHYEQHRDEFEADAVRRAQQQQGPVRVEVTKVK